MKHPVQLKKSISRILSSPYRALRGSGLFLMPVVVAWLMLARQSHAVSPPPDGGYPNDNTGEGEDALFSLDTRTAFGNTAVGWEALFSNTTGSFNTAIGAFTMHDASGQGNTAIGVFALQNTSGRDNTASGNGALASNTTGSQNTATGSVALGYNTTGVDNTATGRAALLSNTTGNSNTAVGG